MREVKADPRKVATVSVVLFLALFTAVLLYFRTPLPALLESLAKAGSVIAIVGLFWVFFNRWGWRFRVFNLFGWLCNTPDLQGRWEGTVHRHGADEQAHPFVLEVSQTFAGLKFCTYGRNSGGTSVSVVIVEKDEQGLMWEARCVWLTKAQRLDGSGQPEDFYGTSTWEIAYANDPKERTIRDTYYTSRRTSGKINLTWVSPKLKGKF